MRFLNRAKKENLTACVAAHAKVSRTAIELLKFTISWAEYMNVPSNVASNRNRTLVHLQNDAGGTQEYADTYNCHLCFEQSSLLREANNCAVLPLPSTRHLMYMLQRYALTTA